LAWRAAGREEKRRRKIVEKIETISAQTVLALSKKKDAHFKRQIKFRFAARNSAK